MANRVVVGDATVGVHGEGYSYIFSAAAGGFESLYKYGKEWLYRVPKPTFWRASTDNDHGNRFSKNSAIWMGNDAYIGLMGGKIFLDGKEVALPFAPDNNGYAGDVTCENVTLIFVYETPTEPKTMVDVTYSIDGKGEILVTVHYHGNPALPELPVFGMRFVMPTKAVGYTYQGLSGETYPDRMAGGIPGEYHVDGLPVTPYMVPQDCGVHMETEWVKIARDSVLDNSAKNVGVSQLTFAMADKKFAFATLPYTSLELENATHMEELPPARRTVVTILGAVRGVGGIDSWGADVEPDYHIPAGEDIKYSFYIR